MKLHSLDSLVSQGQLFHGLMSQCWHLNCDITEEIIELGFQLEVQNLSWVPCESGLTHDSRYFFFFREGLWGTTKIFLWPCVNRDKSNVSGSNFIALVPCNPMQSRSFLDNFDLWSRWKLNTKLEIQRIRIGPFKFCLKCYKCAGNRFDFAHHFYFPSFKVPGSGKVYFMLIFALNFFGSNCIRLSCLKKGEKHEYTSCQVRGFLIIPQT